MNKYAQSGVDVTRGYESVNLIKELVASTYDLNVLSNLKGFSSMYDLSNLDYNDPVIVSGMDGVGSKLMLAMKSNQLDTIGIDVVAMCVNDIITCGATPLYFLDYIATNKIEPLKIKDIVSGVVKGCLESECSLVGGETAEMPSLYALNHFDLAGCATGVVSKQKIVDPTCIESNDVVIGLHSNGIHSNGYSLVNQIFFKDHNFDFTHQFDCLDTTLINELLKPTKIYVKAIKELNKKYHLKAMAHITGGGFYENIPRIADNYEYIIDKDKLVIPPIFKLIQELGQLEDQEMFETFNMGVGFVIVADKSIALEIVATLNNIGYPSNIIGEVKKYRDDSYLSFR